MRLSFHPRTINGPFGDPGVFIPFVFERRAMIFDLGDVHSLSSADILKISHAFVSHTHMDHFVGFDDLLRLFLGREKDFYIYGPEGFLSHVENKLGGYSWNLVKHYDNHFAIHATEIHSDHMLTRQYLCQNKFIPEHEPVRQTFDGMLHQEPSLSVSAIILNHSIPCLGFMLKEQFHVNIVKEKLIELGLETGPWLKIFKQALFNGQSPDSRFEADMGKGNIKQFVLGELTEQIAIITPGQKITYITDTGYNPHDAERMIEFASHADHLFIEAPFLDKDKDIAEKKYHLTARQAGFIAGRAKVKQFTIFHFSPRYSGMEHLLQEEAMQAYVKT